MQIAVLTPNNEGCKKHYTKNKMGSDIGSSVFY